MHAGNTKKSNLGLKQIFDHLLQDINVQMFTPTDYGFGTESQNHQCENHKGLQYDKGAPPPLNKSAWKLHGYIVLAFKI